MIWIAKIILVVGVTAYGDTRMSRGLGRIALPRYTITNAVEVAPLPALVNQFLESECATKNTARAYRQALEIHFLRFLSESSRTPVTSLSFSDITRKRVSMFEASRLEVEAPSSAALRLRVVKAFCGWAAERYGVSNPAHRLRGEQVPQIKFLGLTPENHAAMIRAAKAVELPPARFTPLLLVSTGLRNNDARGLNMGNVSACGEWLMGVRVKGGKRINVPLPHFARQELTRYLYWRKQFEHDPDTPLLITARACRPDNKTIWRWVRDVCGEHPHTLRHTFAYRTLEHLQRKGVRAGEALVMLREMLGHSTITTTLRYLGTDAAVVAELMKELR